MCKSAPKASHGFHCSPPLEFITGFFFSSSIAVHISTLLSKERHRQNPLIQHTVKTYRPLCAASPALDRGKVWHHIWTCMNESDGIKHSVSRRLTQPPVSVSPVWRSPASLSEHHSLWSRCEASSLTNTGPGHPRQPVLRHIFTLDPLMSLPAWANACANKPRDVKGCSGSHFLRSRSRQVHKVMQ